LLKIKENVNTNRTNKKKSLRAGSPEGLGEEKPEEELIGNMLYPYYEQGTDRLYIKESGNKW
jgi:hypothetical protein